MLAISVNGSPLTGKPVSLVGEPAADMFRQPVNVSAAGIQGTLEKFNVGLDAIGVTKGLLHGDFGDVLKGALSLSEEFMEKFDQAMLPDGASPEQETVADFSPSM